MAKAPPGAFRVDRVENLSMDKIKVGKRFRENLGDVQGLALSIEQHGLIHPIVVTNEMDLVVGGRRFAAHKHLERQTIRADVIYINNKVERLELELAENVDRLQMHWTEVALLEKAIYDTKRAKDSKWTSRTQGELRDVSHTTVNVRLKLAEALDLLPDLAQCATQEDAYKKYKKLEEVALIGHLRAKVPDNVKNAPQWANEHYIVGDAREMLPFIMPDSADFAELDPPYAIEIDRRKSRNIDEGHADDYSEIDLKTFPEFMKTVLAETYRILKPDSFVAVWFAMQWYTDLYQWLQLAGFAVNPMPALWYKGQSGQTAQPDVALASSYEPFFLGRKGQPKFMRQGRSNVFHYAPLAPSRKIHPTEKPLPLMEDILGTILFPGSNVLIPFLGSGVTLRAAYKGGHTGIGFDLAPGNRERFLKVVGEEFSPDKTEEAEMEDD